MNKTILDLNLMALYLNSWEEEHKITGKKILRAGKNFLFDLLNHMERENLIKQYTKSITFTEDGKAYAENLLSDYNRCFN
ncbi:MAG: hypothetical protein MUF15_25585 [Acidobacteria bacterium]|jgi:hypothetical protein|nr:hypothetical protein [Acidobacteriota bacterium]